jgi:exopolysaccharide biosynthesis polyprenyl glycosylphosphotransferase
MRRKFDLFFTALQVPLDLVALVGAALTAYTLRYSQALTELRPIFTEINFSEYVVTAIGFSFVWLLLFALAGLYSVRPRKAWNELGRLLVGGTAGTMVLIATVFFQRELTTSRFIVLAVWAFSIAFVWIERLIVRVVRHALLRDGIGHKRVMVVGRGKAANALVELYQKNPILGYTVAARLTDWEKGARESAAKMISTQRVDEIVLADPDLSKEHALEVIAFAEAHHLTFKYLADLFAAKFTNIEVSTTGGIPVIEVKKTPLDGWGRIFKRLFDILASLTLIIIASPVMLLIAVLIKLTSAGPVFFGRSKKDNTVVRIGEGGRSFPYFKFRTMVVGAHKFYNDAAFMKAHGVTRKGLMKINPNNDPRVTTVGRFLRAWSLDELPEFFLVLKGDMSLVGPRPHLPEDVRSYKPHHRRVLDVKPGITGMAQISGRADLNFEEEVRLDTWYIENWSPALDLYILLKTPFVVLARKGAY